MATVKPIPAPPHFNETLQVTAAAGFNPDVPSVIPTLLVRVRDAAGHGVHGLNENNFNVFPVMTEGVEMPISEAVEAFVNGPLLPGCYQVTWVAPPNLPLHRQLLFVVHVIVPGQGPLQETTLFGETYVSVILDG
ncbi:hypothetical protein [Paraburkholderia caribensis]|uniref:hypothetical protein n=1 Tax=Paraburkholderia caribensis TaxID=75105 RepID=UPI001D07C366|nr:hypothetical protein [Paraburkholderia caribensis]